MKKKNYKAHKYYQAGGGAELLLKDSWLHYTCSVLEWSTCEKVPDRLTCFLDISHVFGCMEVSSTIPDLQ